MTSATDNVITALRQHGLDPTISHLDSTAKTAALAAEQLGCPVGAIGNSLIFAADGEPLLVMTSGAHRVDTDVVAAQIGASVIERATAQFVKEHTGQSIGGVAPVGHPQPVRTVVDTALAQFPQVWVAGGHPHAVFPTTFDELLQITKGVPVDVSAQARQ